MTEGFTGLLTDQTQNKRKETAKFVQSPDEDATPREYEFDMKEA